VTEINIVFKDVPPILLSQMDGRDAEPNVITIRVQPNEGISLRLGAKPPGQRTRVKPVDMDFAYGTSFGQRIHDAYERLLMDALLGDAALFTRDDEVEAEWRAGSALRPRTCRTTRRARGGRKRPSRCCPRTTGRGGCASPCLSPTSPAYRSRN
jgi:glucose-6-phosphate 1-dehydrogenase